MTRFNFSNVKFAAVSIAIENSAFTWYGNKWITWKFYSSLLGIFSPIYPQNMFTLQVCTSCWKAGMFLNSFGSFTSLHFLMKISVYRALSDSGSDNDKKLHPNDVLRLEVNPHRCFLKYIRLFCLLSIISR